MDENEKIKVLVTVRYDEQTLKRFQAVDPRLEILARPARTYTDIAGHVWADAEVLYTGGVFPPVDTMPKLKWLQSHFSGVDTVLKQPLLQDKPDLLITSMRGIHATNMGEYVLGMMLALARKVPTLLRRKQEALWGDDERFQALMPVELRGSTVGIVGYGAIGREVARLAKAFGMTVLASKRDLKQLSLSDTYLVEGTGDVEGVLFDRLYPPQALRTMVRDCDFVVITTPYTESTHNLYNADIIAGMKDGAFLINVGRGGVMDEAALLKALKSGRMGGAVLDVFAEEPLPANSPLWQAPNLIITPHISGNTATYLHKAAHVFESNLERYVNHEPLMNVIDRESGY